MTIRERSCVSHFLINTLTKTHLIFLACDSRSIADITKLSAPHDFAHIRFEQQNWRETLRANLYDCTVANLWDLALLPSSASYIVCRKVEQLKWILQKRGEDGRRRSETGEKGEKFTMHTHTHIRIPAYSRVIGSILGRRVCLAGIWWTAVLSLAV